MRATVSAGELAAALKTSVTPSNTPHNAILHARLHAAGDTLHLETTDLSVYVRESIAAQVDEAGTILLRESLLRPIAAADGEIRIGGDGKVSRGRSHFRVPALPADQWPDQDDTRWMPLAVDVGALAAAIRAVSHSATDDDLRPALRGLHIDAGFVWGSDGNAMSFARIDYRGPAITLPDAQTRRVLDMLGEGATLEAANIGSGVAGLLRITHGTRQMTARLLSAKPLELTSTIKAFRYDAAAVRIKRDELLAALRRFMPFAWLNGETKAKGLPVVVLMLQAGELILADRAEENRESLAEAVIEAPGKFRTGVDPRRLIAALGAIDSNTVALHPPTDGAPQRGWLLYADQTDKDDGAHFIAPITI
ncbi:hypothetical protein DYQ93_11610 [Xanthomonas sp. LMG 8992]|uniref:hypothetical protein n=1 Tax=Xanthomonas sp. LMG 8992 TaxID=1591157 RepID=UPI00136D3F37|nr:hypothetical protein [Xanthomonas sp. LMG 8992]MXV11667.1 hypothetical protein [Xanthomonas sp. LMG 8992]